MYLVPNLKLDGYSNISDFLAQNFIVRVVVVLLLAVVLHVESHLDPPIVEVDGPEFLKMRTETKILAPRISHFNANSVYHISPDGNAYVKS